MDVPARLKQALAGSYSIERELGGGGMARVFVAEERALNRRVVVKVLPSDAAGGVSAERFRREVQLAAKLQHPHIVPLLSAGEVDGLPYYVMPYIDGESLRVRVAREHELAIPVVVRILREVADALAYAHAHHVVHRDIKPDNVLMADQHALVTDFGIAKALATARQGTSDEARADTASITQLGVGVGTPAYMAPEQASADPDMDHRVDIYALGVLGYELLTGRPPFSASSPHALLAAVISAQPAPVGTLRPTVPPALAALIMRCLEKRPADRPQTATEVLHELEAQTTPQGTMAAAAAPRPAARRWAVAAGIAAAVIGGAVAIAAMRRGNVATEASSIAVLPFTPTSPDTALSRLGRDLVVTVSTNLDGVGSIRAADPLTTLGLAGMEPMSRANAQMLATKVHARSFVQGTIVREAGRVRLDFALYPSSGGDPIARGSATAPADSVSALTDSVTWSLLRQVWRTDKVPLPSVGAITTRSMSALRAYLEGEQARADGRYLDAVAAFDRAIEADSTFWLAYIRAVGARAWMFLPIDTTLRRYRSHLDELPERDRAMIAANAAGSLTAKIAAHRKVAERFPDAWTSSLAAGDLIVHNGPLVGIPIEQARADLERVVTLNPRWTEAWHHLYLIAAQRDGFASPGADSIARKLVELGYDTASARTYAGLSEPQLWRMTHHLIQDSAAIASPLTDSVVTIMAKMRLQPLMASLLPAFVSMPPGSGRAQIDFSGRVLARGTGEREMLAHRSAIEWAWASRGAYDSALTLVDERARSARTDIAELDRLRIAALAEFSGAVPGAFESRWKSSERLMASANRSAIAEAHWMRGAIAATRRDHATLAAASESLARIGSDGVRSIDYLRRNLRAFVAEVRGHPEAADSLVAVEMHAAESDTIGFPVAISRSAASRWLQRAGRSDEARRLLVWQEGIVPDRSFFAAKFMFQPLVLLERARLAEAAGEAEQARRFYSEFLLRFDRPMRPHQGLVSEARAALERLGRPEPAR